MGTRRNTATTPSAATNVQVHTPPTSAGNHRKPQRSASTVKVTILPTTKAAQPTKLCTQANTPNLEQKRKITKHPARRNPPLSQSPQPIKHPALSNSPLPQTPMLKRYKALKIHQIATGILPKIVPPPHLTQTTSLDLKS